MAGDGAERGVRLWLVGKELLDALLRLGGDLVGPLVVLAGCARRAAARISSRCLFLRSSSVELGVEPPLGPFDEVLALEALLLAGRAAGREAIQAGEHRVFRFALVVRRDRPLVGQLDELGRLELARLLRARSRRRTCRAARRRPSARRSPAPR